MPLIEVRKTALATDPWQYRCPQPPPENRRRIQQSVDGVSLSALQRQYRTPSSKESCQFLPGLCVANNKKPATSEGGRRSPCLRIGDLDPHLKCLRASRRGKPAIQARIPENIETENRGPRQDR